MVKTTLIAGLLACAAASGFAQADTSAPTLNQHRLLITAAANAGFWTASYLALDNAWYAGYPRSRFHFFNDDAEWNQMDKAGHAWTSYTLSRASAKMWRWTGLSDNASALLGGASGLVYQSIIELQDGFSSEWGFSWGDMGANAFGSLLFASQQVAWKEQKIALKISYTPYRYPAGVNDRRNDLFGTTLAERMLKDYNSQTYWASINISSLGTGDRFPKWLNVALGYGADGMLGARGNTWMDREGKEHDFQYIARTRRFYLSPDVDLTRIKTKSRVLRSVFFVLNMIKVPAPALELSSKGRLQFHAIRF